MTCKTCGDKTKKDRHFPSAVVEINNPESLVLLRKVVIPASMGDDTTVPPAIGKYRNVVLVYEANDHIYLYSSDGIPTLLKTEVPQEVLDRITELESDVTALERGLETETGARERADGVLQQEIDDLKNSPDVVDIVATYADLMAYDTSSLGDKDVIRVLADETHDGESAYYRWIASTQTWSFIGTVGNYYTKDQTDALLDDKQDELTPGENISIVDESGELVISAQDTTYTAGNGLSLNGTQFSVDTTTIATQSDLTTGLATKQNTLTAGSNIKISNDTISATDTTYTAGYGLELEGTEFSVDSGIIQDTLTAGDNIAIEDESGSLVISATDTTYSAGTGLNLNGTQFSVDTTTIAEKSDVPTVVQATGNSATDVMSQNATTNMVFADPSTRRKLRIGDGATVSGNEGLAIGGYAESVGGWNVALGGGTTHASSAQALAEGAVSIGSFTTASGVGSIAIGAGAATNVKGVMAIGTTASGYGYNDTAYRLLTGLYDPQSAHDAATKGYVDTAMSGKQDELTPGDNITIEDESGSLVISAADSLSPTTTFWGQTANNGVVDGLLTITNNGGLPTMVFGAGSIRIERAGYFKLSALKTGSTYSDVLWWNSASNNVPSNIHIDAANAHLVLKDNGVLSLRNDANGPLTVSGVKDPQSANDAATKGYVDNSIPAAFTTNEWNALWA